MLSDRTKQYAEALIKLGSAFDYDAWLTEVRQADAHHAVDRNPVDDAHREAVPMPAIDEVVPNRIDQAIFHGPRSTPELGLRVNRRKPTCYSLPVGIGRSLRSESGDRRSALDSELAPVRAAFHAFQSSRSRDAIYSFLRVVFDLVQRWTKGGKGRKRVAAIRKSRGVVAGCSEPYAAVILATTDVDAKTRSKWSRVLRYVARYKPDHKTVRAFIRRRGGLNGCAAKVARHERRKKRQ